MWCCEWRPVLYDQHGPVFNYSLISSHHGAKGFESIWRQEGGSLFTLVVVFLSFCGGRELVLRGFVSGDKRGRLGPALPRLFMSLYGSAQTHIRHILNRTNTSSRSCILFSLRRHIVEALSLSLQPSLPSPPEGFSLNKGKQACFCLGCRP